ncbi:unnamed protein product [Discosporangium mesarthrocarpum]
MEEEISGLVRNGVWVRSDLPPGHKPTETNWYFRGKLISLGKLCDTRGDWLLLEYQQREVRDFHETCMPTPSQAVLRITGAVAAAENWYLFHWDIAQFFITANVEENIHIRLCDGCGPWSEKIMRSRKALCGTRQAGRAFPLHLVHVLKELDIFEKCAVDPCQFHLVHDRELCAVIATHVDGLMVTREGAALSWTKSYLSEHFNTSDLGELTFYMGCEISREDRSTHTITSKRHRTSNLRKRFGATECSKTVAHVPSRRLDGEHGQTPVYIPYRRAAGSVMWAAVMT